MNGTGEYTQLCALLGQYVTSWQVCKAGKHAARDLTRMKCDHEPVQTHNAGSLPQC